MMGNPIIRHKFTADPTVIEHHETGYLYPGHDDPPDGLAAVTEDPFV